MERVSENFSDSLSPQPQTSSDTAAATLNHENSVIECNDDGLPFLDAYTEPVSEDFWTDPYLIDKSYVPPEYETDYFSSMYDVELWSQNDLFLNECEGLFY